MKKWRSWLILLIILGGLVGLYFLSQAIFGSGTTLLSARLHTPKPKPDVVLRFRIGGLAIPITSTAFSSLVAMLVLVLLSALIYRGLARRSEEERLRNPTGWQNLVEWAVEYVIRLLEPAAGRGRLKKRPIGRVIFPLVGTLFIFIIFANWFSLLPGFSTILVKPTFMPVEEASIERIPAGDLCPGDWVTLHALAGQATAPHYEWYVDGERQEGHGEEEAAWLDYHLTEPHTVTVRLVAWNEEDGERHQAEATLALVPLSGEAARAAGCGTEARPAAQPAKHEEHENPTLLWFFGGDHPGEPVPLLRAPNSHLAITAGMAVVAIVTVQALGVMAHGPMGYLRHLATDAPAWMKPIMFPIHVVSELSRVISLSARLFGNLYGGDVLLAVIFNLLAPLIPAVFLGIEAFFYYIQALLFSVLTTVYIALAVGGGHEEAHR
ncbi:MAG: F0F1 ATP synthase subunit A [Chloroflexia bacterium]